MFQFLVRLGPLAFTRSSAARTVKAICQRKLAAAKVAISEEDHGAQHSIYFEDPNGVMLEITAPASGRGAKQNKRASQTIVEWVTREGRV